MLVYRLLCYFIFVFLSVLLNLFFCSVWIEGSMFLDSGVLGMNNLLYYLFNFFLLFLFSWWLYFKFVVSLMIFMVNWFFF